MGPRRTPVTVTGRFELRGRRLVSFATVLVATCGGQAPLGTDDPSDAPPDPAEVSFARVEGTIGTGSEIRVPVSYEVLITLAAGAPVGARIGTVSYGGGSCGGNLYVREVTGDIYVVDERITFGGGCIDRGTIRLRYDGGDTLAYEMVLAPGGSTVRDRGPGPSVGVTHAFETGRFGKDQKSSTWR